MATFTAVVELQLGDAQTTHPFVVDHLIPEDAPLEAGAWEAYPHGGDDARIVTEDDGSFRLETDAEHEARVLAACYTFIQNQHDYGTPPLAWRIKVDGKIVDQGAFNAG